MNRFLLLLLIVCLPFSGFSQNGKSTKRGIAYGYHSQKDMAAISAGTCWWYNWSPVPESGVATVFQTYNMDFVPMAWNGSFNETALKNFYKTHPNARYILAFNEPNFTTQANMTPRQAAAVWPRLEAIADSFNLKIVSPAVNYCDQCISVNGVKITSPVAYLDSFFVACPDCRVDYIAVHNYMCYAGSLTNYLDAFKKYKKKIWLTEFACWDQANMTLTMQKNLMKGAIDAMENDTMIFRYSWFTGDRSGAYPYLDIYAPTSGSLTELGQFYVNYKAYVPDTSYYIPVPGRFEAEHFLAMSGVSTEAVTDFDGTDDVGYIDAGDWLEYQIEVPDTAVYYLYARIASTATSSIIFKIDGVNSDTLKITSTGGWQTWKTMSVPVHLPKGKHKIKAYTPTGKFNLNWFRISDHVNTAPLVNAGANQIITYPETVANLNGSITDPDNDEFSYKWTKISGPTSYSISDPSSHNPVVTGLVKGKYTFRLTVSDGTEVAMASTQVELVYATGTDVVNSSESIYPNPFTDVLRIQNEGVIGKTIVSVSDPSGRIILSQSFTGTELIELNTSDLPKGYYFIRIERDSKSSVSPVIKL